MVLAHTIGLNLVHLLVDHNLVLCFIIVPELLIGRTHFGFKVSWVSYCPYPYTENPDQLDRVSGHFWIYIPHYQESQQESPLHSHGTPKIPGLLHVLEFAHHSHPKLLSLSLTFSRPNSSPISAPLPILFPTNFFLPSNSDIYFFSF